MINQKSFVDVVFWTTNDGIDGRRRWCAYGRTLSNGVVLIDSDRIRGSACYSSRSSTWDQGDSDCRPDYSGSDLNDPTLYGVGVKQLKSGSIWVIPAMMDPIVNIFDGRGRPCLPKPTI